MKKIILTLLLALTLPVCAKAADSKDFNGTADIVFVKTLDAINKMNCEVAQMQASTGYIFFKNPQNDFYLVMISDNGNNTSNVKLMRVSTKSPLEEVQSSFYSNLEQNMSDTPKKADEWANMPFVLLI